MAIMKILENGLKFNYQFVMKIIYQYILFVIISNILISVNLVYSQSNISLKLSTLSYQFSEAQPELVKIKLSSDGKLAIEPGLIFAYEAYASSNTAIKLSQSLLLDKALRLASVSQILIKFRLAKSFKHSVYLGIGPVFHYRQSWTKFENYTDEPVYNQSGDWQYKLSWISGEIEYNYYLSKYTDLSVSINHIQAESVGIAVGLKYWISKTPPKKRGCVSCPGLH